MALARRTAVRKNANLKGRVVPVPADGACFFHALSIVLKKAGISNLDAQALRRAGIQYMQEHQTKFAAFCAPSDRSIDVNTKGYSYDKPAQPESQRFSEYCNVMSQPGTWADETIILALAEKFQLAIEVHTPKDGLSYTVMADQTKPRATVELSLQGSHYEAVMPVVAGDPAAQNDEQLARQLQTQEDERFARQLQAEERQQVAAERAPQLESDAALARKLTQEEHDRQVALELAGQFAREAGVVSSASPAAAIEAQEKALKAFEQAHSNKDASTTSTRVFEKHLRKNLVAPTPAAAAAA